MFPCITVDGPRRYKLTLLTLSEKTNQPDPSIVRLAVGINTVVSSAIFFSTFHSLFMSVRHFRASQTWLLIFLVYHPHLQIPTFLGPSSILVHAHELPLCTPPMEHLPSAGSLHRSICKTEVCTIHPMSAS